MGQCEVVRIAARSSKGRLFPVALWSEAKLQNEPGNIRWAWLTLGTNGSCEIVYTDPYKIIFSSPTDSTEETLLSQVR
jgi:hypothetical protein